MANKWRKGTDGWYVLANLDLSAVEETGGVYVIWTELAICLWVGQTENFRDRFREHRRSSETKPLRFDRSGNIVLRVSDYVKMQPMNVFVTWLPAAAADWDGMERHLYDHYKPELVMRRPEVKPIPVQRPW